MKILLISTSTYPSDQGLRSLSSNLKRADYVVKLVFMVEKEDYAAIYSNKALSQLKNLAKDFDVIGISSYASTSIRAEQIINHLKPLNKPIVWGGVHATISPENCINHADYVCRGEGEAAFIEFLKKYESKEDLTDLKNFWFRKNSKIYKNDVRNYVEFLDDLAPPDYDLEDHYILEKNKLVSFQERHLNGQIFFQTERGCPNACTYCSNGFFRRLYFRKGKPIRAHSFDYVVDEMKRLKDKFPSLAFFDIRDETFLIRSLEDLEYFADLYKKKVNLRFKCLADPPTTDYNKLKVLVDAGLTDIIIGIQGGTDRVNLEIYKRYIKQEQIIKSAEILNKFKDLVVMYDIITTNPYEEREDVLGTINLVLDLPKPFYLSVNNLVFFLGTPLYDQAIKDGFIKTRRDSAFNLNYWDRWKHIKLKKKNAYLNLILNLMRGPCTDKRCGILPVFLIRFLIKESIVNFNLKHESLTYTTGYILQFFDFIRENIAKPVYRSMPTNFKVWYDNVRYRV